MTYSGKFRHLVAAAALTASLAGCTTSGDRTTSDDRIGRFLVAPDKYVLYNCAQLADRATALGTREKELQRLMVKAGQGSGGRMVSTVAYRPEYLELRGDINELRRAAIAKNCKSVPGTEVPDGRVSDKIIR